MPSPDGNCVRRLFAPSIFLIPSTSYRDALNNTHLIIHGPTAMASGGNLAKFKVPQPLEAKSRQQKRGSPTAGSDGLLVFVFLRRPLAIRSRKNRAGRPPPWNRTPRRSRPTTSSPRADGTRSGNGTGNRPTGKFGFLLVRLAACFPISHPDLPV